MYSSFYQQSSLVRSASARGHDRVDVGFTILDQREAELVVLDAGIEGVRVAWSDSSGGRWRGSLSGDGEVTRLVPDTPADVSGEVRLAFAVYGIPVEVQCHAIEGQLRTPMSVWSAEQRAATRVVPREPIEIEWCATDGDGVASYRAPLIDIGTRGARSFHASGTPLPAATSFAATIHARSELVACMVRVRSKTETLQGVELGLEIVAVHAGALADIVLRTLFPQVRPRREVSHEALCRLFKDSGYLRLREGCVPSPEWSALDADEVTRDLVYVADNGQPIAHGSVTRAYRNTWLGHQTAMLSKHEEAARARRLLTTMTMITSLLDGTAGRLIAYYDPTNTYGRVFFDRFAKWIQNPGLAVVTHLDWFERDALPANLDTEVPDSISVGLATPRELTFVTDLVRSQLPELLSDAMDMHPSLLRTSAMHPAYEGSALTRSREVFVVRKQGRCIGAALCELSSKELSLFNTLNLVQFFFPSGQKDPVAQRVLQHHVRDYYDSRGIKAPFVLSPPGTFDASLLSRMGPANRTGCITWTFDGIRAYENYVRLRCAFLERGRRPKLKSRTAEIPVSQIPSEVRSERSVAH